VRFTLEQQLPGRVADVITALLDPAFIAALGELPNLAPPEVIGQTRSDDTVVQRIRYRFTGTLSSAVTRVIDPRKLTWVDETTYDLAAGRATFRIIPDHYAGKLRCSGTYVFTAASPRTVRRATGELTVGVPLLGRIVERALVSGLAEHLEAEAHLLGAWLERNA
jgi:hypothetical protein